MTSKYERLANLLRGQIKDYIAEGQNKLPTEMELCSRYGVSRQTVRQALSVLIDENLIEQRQGSGTYITASVASSKRNIIAILVSNRYEYTYPSILKDISVPLEANGYTISIYVTDDKVSTERHILTSLLETPPAGIIAEPSHSSLPNPNLDIYERFTDNGVPVLFFMGNYSNFEFFPYIRSDDVYGGYLLGKHLIGRNHSNIATLFNGDDIRGCDRYLGVSMALADSHILLDDDNFYFYNTRLLEELRSNASNTFISDFISNHLNGITAIVCQNDEIAYFLIKEITQNGLIVPDNYSVVSFDNSYLSDFGSYHITSLSHNPHELSKAVVSSMLQLLKSNTISSRKLSWHLISRSSDNFYNKNPG